MPRAVVNKIYGYRDLTGAFASTHARGYAMRTMQLVIAGRGKSEGYLEGDLEVQKVRILMSHNRSC